MRILLLFIFCKILLADSLTQHYIDRALETNLYENKHWHTLLHFRGRKSDIDDKYFFYSKVNDKSLPKNEMIATIKAFYENPDEVSIPKDLRDRIAISNTRYDKDSKLPKASLRNEDYHAICRFPARFEFLDKYLKFENLPKVECKEYNDMLNYVQPRKAIVVFPSAYINSPASSFGHTFILLQGKYKNKLLSFAINYAADVNSHNENLLKFTMRGLFGGYTGRYSILPYYEKIKEYRDVENRDIWEFPLNLSEEEVKRLFAHLWEVRNNEDRYLFLTKNCSYNILWLIEAARDDVNIRKYFIYHVNPPETIFAMQRENLIESQIYRPSKRSLIYAYKDNLSLKLINKAKKISKGKLDSNAILNEDISLEQKQKTLELSQELTEYYAIKGKMDKQTYIDTAHNIAKSRSQLGRGSEIKVPTPTPMLNGNQAARISAFDLFKNNKHHVGFEFRLLHHDITDSDIGYLRGVGIEFLKARFYIDDKGLQLDEGKILGLESYGTTDSVFKSISFRFNMGFDRSFLVDLPNYYIRLGGGFSFNLFNRGYVYYMLEPVFFVDNGGRFSLSNVFGVNIGRKKLKLSIEYSNRIYFNAINSNIINATFHINVVRNLALFINYRHYFYNQTYNDRYVITAGVRTYF